MQTPNPPTKHPIHPINNCMDLLILPLIPHTSLGVGVGVLNEGLGI